MKIISPQMMATEQVEDFSILCKNTHPGITKWVDEQGLAHREDGPAYIYRCEQHSWFRHGKIHRVAGPAVYNKHYEIWMQNGLYHREDGPAYIDGSRFYWYLNGKEVSEAEVRALGKMK